MQTLNNFFDSKKNAVLLFILSFSVAIVFSFLNVDYSDNPYQINVANLYLQNNEFTSGLTFLSQYLYAKTILIFGDYFFVAKLLNSLFVFFTAFTPFILFYKKKSGIPFIILASISFLLFAPFSRLSIGWDAIADFFVIVSVVFFIKYLEKPKWYFAFILCISLIFSIYTKTTFVLLPPLFLLTYIMFYKINKLKINYLNLIIFIFMFLIVFNFLLFFFFKTPLNYYESLIGKEEFNDSYSIFGLLERIMNHLKFSIKPLFFFCYYYLFFVKLKPTIYVKSFQLVGVLLFSYFIYNFISIERGFYIYILVITTFILCWLVMEVFQKKELSISNKVLIVFLILISFYPTIGSNTGLSKNSLILFFPLIFMYFNLKFNSKIYMKLLYFIGVYIVLLRLFNFIDFQKINSDFVINSGKLYPMVSQTATQTRLNEVDNYLKTNGIKHFYFYSLDAHLFEYYLNGNLIFNSFDRNLENVNEWNRFKIVIENTKDNVYLFIPKSAISYNSKNPIFLKNIENFAIESKDFSSFKVYKF
jgi:hypothetical protein